MCNTQENSDFRKSSVENPFASATITVTPSIVPSLISKRYTLCLRTSTHVWRKIYLSPEDVVPDVEALRLVGEHRFEDLEVPLWLAIRRTLREVIDVETSDLQIRSFSRSRRNKRFREAPAPEL
jgi:hypothetical protein